MLYQLMNLIELFFLQVGMVVYSRTATNRFYLNSYSTSSSIIAQVRGTSYIGTTTNTSGAIRLMKNEQFVSSRGDRSDYQNVGK